MGIKMLNFKRNIFLALSGVVLAASNHVYAYDYNAAGRTKHSNNFGMGDYNGQYPMVIDGQQRVANHNQAEQLYKRAMALDSNKNGFDSNRTQAIQMWEEAAQYWHSPSRYEAGYAYYVGDGVDVDVPKANSLLEYAAKREHPDALGLYLVSQMYDKKYRTLSNKLLLQYAEMSVQADRNVYGMLAYLKMYQEGILKSSDPNREQEIKRVIRLRLSNPKASRVEKNHIPKVISVLKINL